MDWNKRCVCVCVRAPHYVVQYGSPSAAPPPSPPKERTEKIALGSIKAVISEPIKGHEEYHIMVGAAILPLPALSV